MMAILHQVIDVMSLNRISIKLSKFAINYYSVLIHSGKKTLY
jgi:hypothetical protein